MQDDAYRATAGMYDLIAASYVPEQLRAVTALCDHIDPQDGPVLDIGCGSGRPLAHLLERLPETQAVGLEPSAAMRALALGRLGSTPSWRERVTIRPEGALDAPLPDRLSGAIMLGVFGHFAPDERHPLLARLAARLGPRGAILLDLQPPETPAELAREIVADTNLGALRYQCLAEGVPIDDERMRWRMTYRTLDDDEPLDEQSCDFEFRHPHPQRVREEFREHGFTLTRLDDSTYWLATRPA